MKLVKKEKANMERTGKLKWQVPRLIALNKVTKGVGDTCEPGSMAFGYCHGGDTALTSCSDGGWVD